MEMPRNRQGGYTGRSQERSACRDRLRRWIRSMVAGVACPLLQLAVQPDLRQPIGWIELSAILGCYLAALGFISWPLSSYRLVGCVCLMAAIGYTIVGGINTVSACRGGVFERAWLPYITIPLTLVLVWGSSWSALSAAVFTRNRWWPVFPPGHCNKCGYNLFGLASRRCPECGTPFEHSACGDGTSCDTSAGAEGE